MKIEQSVVIVRADIDRCSHINAVKWWPYVDSLIEDVGGLLSSASNQPAQRLSGTDEWVLAFDTVEAASVAAESARAAVEAKYSGLTEEVRAGAHAAGVTTPVGPVGTLSFGISQPAPRDLAIEQAAEALDASKLRGRNRVTKYGDAND